MWRVSLVLGAVLFAATSLACDNTATEVPCTLQMMLAVRPESVAVGDTAVLMATQLPMLPPGDACGPASLTWSLSDSSLASVRWTRGTSAAVTAVRPGQLLVTVHATARRHQADAAAALVIAAPPSASIAGRP